MTFELTILGSSSAAPTAYRNPSAQLLNVAERLFLIDCAEATQIQLRRFKLKFQRIDHIFISHLHGDHYLGLPGLIFSMHLLGRNKELHIYSPPGLKEIIDIHIKHSNTSVGYELIFHEITSDDSEVLLNNKVVKVETIPLKHRVPCYGYVFSEKPKERKLIKEKIAEAKIPIKGLAKLKKGKDYESEDGVVFSFEEFTHPPEPSRSYAYCSDTIYNEDIVKHLTDVDLLYHEATFKNDLEQRAKETFHSTTSQAAKIATLCGAKELLIGHFSTRYRNLDELLDEAKEVFPNTKLAIEGETFAV